MENKNIIPEKFSKYFNTITKDELCELYGMDKDEVADIGSSPEGYNDYTLVGYAVAKDEYKDVLSANGLCDVDVYKNDNGETFMGMFAGDRLYDVGDEIMELVGDKN